MVERVKCTNGTCQSTILPSTAERTGGICMPCKQHRDRQEEERYILENMKEVNLYKGIEDRIEIIKIMHTSHPYDPLIKYVPYPIPIEILYARLSEHEVRRLVSYIEKKAVSEGIECIEDIALELAAFKNINLSKLQRIMLDKHEYCPSLLFKNADKEVVYKLISRLESEQDDLNNILLALAWAGTEAVVAKFSQWTHNSPAWIENLYIPPEQYSKDAGWELNSSFNKKKLFFENCYPLIDSKEMKSSDALSTCVKSNESCRWCGRRLTNLLEIDLSEPIFAFLPIQEGYLVVTTCETCSCYSDVLFMDVTVAGKASWSEYNGKANFVPDDSGDWEYMPANCLSLSLESRAPDYASNQFLPTCFSQLGGMPTWIQDFSYPACPKCKNTMMFLAQISNEDLEVYGEGIYYSFICSDCKITATNYQQT